MSSCGFTVLRGKILEIHMENLFAPAKLLLGIVLKSLLFLFTQLNTAYGAALMYTQNDDDELAYSDYEIDNYANGDDIVDQTPQLSSPTNTFSQPFIPTYESDPLEGVTFGPFGVRPCDRKVDLYISAARQTKYKWPKQPTEGEVDQLSQ